MQNNNVYETNFAQQFEQKSTEDVMMMKKKKENEMFAQIRTQNGPVGCTRKHPVKEIGKEFLVNTNQTDDQRNPSIGSVGKNKEKFVITWQSYGQDESYDGIFYQLFDSSDGNKIGSESQANEYTSSKQTNPTIASIGNNDEKFVIAWQSYGQDGSGYGVYYALFNSSNGNKIVGEQRANQETKGDQGKPQIASTGKNKEKFVITWHHQDLSTLINAQMFNSLDGKTIGDQFLVSEGKDEPSITSINGGGEDREGEKFVICWQNYDSSNYEVFCQMFNSSDATKLGGEFQVNTKSANEPPNPSVTSIKGCEGENFVVTWKSNEQGSGGGTYAIYGQIFNSTDRSKIGLEFQIANSTVSEQTNPTVSSIDTDKENFVITWTIADQLGTGDEVFAQVFESNSGAKIYDEDILVNNFTSNNQNLSHIGSIDNGADAKFIIVWQSGGQDNGGSADLGIFAQIYDSNLICYCEEGTYCNTTIHDECQQCPTGTYNPDQGSISIGDCTECSKGKYQNLTGQSACHLCGQGEYQDQEGQSFCQQCPTGTYNQEEGSMSIGDCTECSKGKYQNLTGQSACHLCGQGTYQDQEGQSLCQACETGQYQKFEGKTSCTNCTRGQYQNLEGQSSCHLCGIGTSQDQEGQSFCQACETGQYQKFEGKTSCVECSIGKYQHLKGESTCHSCAQGTFGNERGLSSCHDCLLGSYSDQEGATTCELCEAGTYQDQKGKITCKNCGFDTWQPNIGSQQCNYCPLNSETLSSKTTSIKECFCEIGYYGKPGEYCEKCPAEGICDTFNQHYPKPKPGYWNSQENPTELIECQILDACPGEKIETCNEQLGYTGNQCAECMVDFYKRDSKCEKCPNNATRRFIFILLGIFALLLILLFIAKKATSYFGSFTISFSFFQLLVIIYKLNVNWPTDISNTLEIFLPFNFNLDFLAMECSFSFSYIEKWFIIEFSPFIFALFFLLIYFTLVFHSKFLTKFNDKINNNFITNKFPKLFYKPSKKVDHRLIYYLHLIKYYLLSPLFQCLSQPELIKSKDIFINVYLTLLTLLYLILSQKCLEIFNCQYDPQSKQHIFLQDTNHVCFGSWWRKILPFTIVFLILYIIGIPLLIVYLLIKNSKKLTEKQFDLKFGLLCSRYNKSFFFWEIIIMLRKLVLITVALFLANHPIIQLILIVLFLLFFLVIQFKYKPYIENRHNFLETLLLSNPQFILFSGFIFKTNELEKNSENNQKLINTVIFVLIITICILFTITFLDFYFRVKFLKTNKKYGYNNDNIFRKDIQMNNKNNLKFLFKNYYTLNNNRHDKQNQNNLQLRLILDWLASVNNKRLLKIDSFIKKIFIDQSTISHESDINDENKNDNDNLDNDDAEKKVDNKQKTENVNNLNQNKYIYKKKQIFFKQKNDTLSIFEEFFKNDLILKFIKWYHLNANLNQKIQINRLIQNFNSYQKKTNKIDCFRK
ncbi:g protein-coupled receptor-related [Anaeramoeba flamelloides]|uniref:G protein-coupled receptor-related n=1 Tax=Anaeramoeba flamelloides TaxID=1746091 RepID=A0AAV7Y5V0_9EUKA|nr:g protein-coupled receptor-related [Anaeramoeba flamelloides]